ncbi:MAG: hypothetical protein WC960_05410 [Bacteroidales bacterium]
MKRTLLLAATLSLTFTLSAQGALDALRFSQNIYEGSARTIALGNAFTSLGGDPYSMSINPASSAILQNSIFSITPSLTSEIRESNYLGNIESEKWNRFGVSSIGIISPVKGYSSIAGLSSFSLGLALNKLSNFSARSHSTGSTSMSSWLGAVASNLDGINNSYLDITDSRNPFLESGDAPWRAILAWNSNLLDPLLYDDQYIAATENFDGSSIFVPGGLKQEHFREQKGGKNELVLNMSANFSNRFFVGFNLGIESVEYFEYEKYSESALYPYQFDSQFSNFSHTFRLNSDGVGVNLKAGMIYLPTDQLRLGASISTPTWLFIRDNWDEQIYAHFSDGYTKELESPLGEYNYRVNTPFRWNLGLSYLFGQFGFIAIDYEGADYSEISMLSQSGSRYTFRDANEEIAQNFQVGHNLRAGVEIRVMPNLSLRGGYSFYGNPEREIGHHLHFLSGGVGFTFSSGGFLDLAFQKRVQNEEFFSLYPDYGAIEAPIGATLLKGWKALISFGVRF